MADAKKLDAETIQRGRDTPPPQQTRSEGGGDESWRGVPPRYRGAALTDEYPMAMMEAVERAVRIASNAPIMMLLYGPPGVGKTHLAAAVVNERRHKGFEYPSFFWEVPEFLAWLRRSIRDEAMPDVDEIVARYSDPGFVLVLDDLGAHNPTDWAEEQLYRIINGRYNNRAPTLATSNVPIERLDPRIRSRFREGLVICEGEDRRGRA